MRHCRLLALVALMAACSSSGASSGNTTTTLLIASGDQQVATFSTQLGTACREGRRRCEPRGDVQDREAGRCSAAAASSPTACRRSTTTARARVLYTVGLGVRTAIDPCKHRRCGLSDIHGHIGRKCIRAERSERRHAGRQSVNSAPGASRRAGSRTAPARSGRSHGRLVRSHGRWDRVTNQFTDRRERTRHDLFTLGPVNGPQAVRATVFNAAPLTFTATANSVAGAPLLVAIVPAPSGATFTHDSFIRDGLAFVCEWTQGS